VQLPPPPSPVAPLPGRTPRGRRPIGPALFLSVSLLLLVSFGVGVLVFPAPSEGSIGPHAFLRMYQGLPVRWDPCDPIHYVVNADRGPAEAVDDIHRAVDRVSEVTGLTFVDDGSTDWTAARQLSMRFFDLQEGFLPVLVVWTGHHEFVRLARTRHAAAFAIPHPGSGPDAATYLSGLVVVDAGAGIPSGSGGRYALVPLLMHELGHLVGLAHVVDGHQLMYSQLLSGAARYPDLNQTDWGPGDLQGLRELAEPACSN